MRGIELNTDVYSDLFKSNVWGNAGIKVKVDEAKVEKVEEAKKPETKEEEVIEEGVEETHVCPLCESKLEQDISDERLQEFIDYTLEVINEAFETEELEDSEETEEDK